MGKKWSQCILSPINKYMNSVNYVSILTFYRKWTLSKNHFLENYFIFLYLITALKRVWKLSFHLSYLAMTWDKIVLHKILMENNAILCQTKQEKSKYKVRLDWAYYYWNWKLKVIFKCVNSTVGPIFNIF